MTFMMRSVCYYLLLGPGLGSKAYIPSRTLDGGDRGRWQATETGYLPTARCARRKADNGDHVIGIGGAGSAHGLGKLLNATQEEFAASLQIEVAIVSVSTALLVSGEVGAVDL